MPVTQKDIARQLGVSRSLVSRALTGTAEAIGAHPATILRIQDTARKLGYIPNATARKLRGKGKPVIGVMIADMGDPYFSQTATEVIRQVHARGFALAVAGFDRRIVDHDDIMVLLEQDLAGLLMIGGADIPWLNLFPRRKLPVVRIGDAKREADIHHVGVDDTSGFRQLFRHLFKHGHRRIGWVTANQPVHQSRASRARIIARQVGLKWNNKHDISGGNEVLLAGREGGQRLLAASAKSLPTAVVCSSDAIALGVISVLTAGGLRVPGDLSVTGFDDLALSSLASPPLTTLHQPISDMIRNALDLLSYPSLRIIHKKFPAQLVVRASTGAAI
ncbi:MAG TPA: LacI family DNA-binding transcriptional regulator [Kiritimatiellia bacterium]|nr:LacI family DNA-binding transcriptional regulator [Kiritimatiellia bacterium]